MNPVRTILGFIWAVWGSVWFMLIITFFTPIYAVVLYGWGKKYSMHCVWINCRVLCPALLTLCLIKLKTYGRDKIDTTRTYVFVGNHNAQMDIVAGAAAMPKPIRFLSKKEAGKIPIFGFMVKMLAIMVDRQSKESREKSVQYMAEELRKGNSIFIYPEGTRNRTEQPLKEFKDGAFRLAIMAQMPIVVQTLIGTRKVNDPRTIHLQPGVVKAYFSSPIETTGLTLNDLPALREQVRQEMLKQLVKN